MEKENIDLQKALDASLDGGRFPDIFPIDFCTNIELKSRPELKVTVKNPRRVKITISSFIGIYGGAVHYYATIKADGITFIKEENGRTVITSGYLGEEYRELCKKLGYTPDGMYSIEVVRPLTQKEIDDDPIRWEYYHAGQRTNAFYSYEEALEQAMKVVNARFPGWEIEIEEF